MLKQKIIEAQVFTLLYIEEANVKCLKVVNPGDM